MTIQADTPVGQIATEYPMATKVFARHGMDFCCGGGKPIQNVCDSKGLDVAAVLDEIREAVADPDSDLERWDDAPLDALITHILTTYHAPLKEELQRLEFMATKVNTIHGSKMPEVLPELLSTVLALKAELEAHMAKEEQILFPLILQGRGTMAGGPIAVMESEHQSAGDALGRLRQLTGDFEVPHGACNTWRALWHGLAALETETHQHIHLENNILFPRALAG